MGYGKGKRKVKGKKEAETWMFASLSPQIFWHVLYESFILIAAAWCSQGSRLLCIGRTVGMLCNIPSFFFPSPYTATPYIELGLFMIVQLLFISFLAPSLRHRFGRSSPNFDARSTVTRIYKKTESEILGFSPPPKKKLAAHKQWKFVPNFGQLRNVIANIFGMKQQKRHCNLQSLMRMNS